MQGLPTIPLLQSSMGRPRVWKGSWVKTYPDTCRWRQQKRQRWERPNLMTSLRRCVSGVVEAEGILFTYFFCVLVSEHLCSRLQIWCIVFGNSVTLGQKADVQAQRFTHTKLFRQWLIRRKAKVKRKWSLCENMHLGRAGRNVDSPLLSSNNLYIKY